MGTFDRIVPHSGGTPHADFQIWVNSGDTRIPMYVNVNVQDRNRKNDLVQVTDPQAITSALPESQGIMFDDTTDAPPALSYIQQNLQQSNFLEKNAEKMKALIQGAVTQAQVIALWGQIYVVRTPCLFRFLSKIIC